MGRGRLGKLWILCLAVAILAVAREAGKQYGWDKDAALQMFRGLSYKLGIWVIPLYVMLHTLTLSLCLPYAIFFEAGASLLFGFLPAIICVFSAKILAASLSFWIGRQWMMDGAKEAIQRRMKNRWDYMPYWVIVGCLGHTWDNQLRGTLHAARIDTIDA